ncbi:TPA: helix-turn-helix transcriptional regulator, partial [Escherichia coli]
MDISRFIFSNNFFFSVGINELLTRPVIDCSFYIIDVESIYHNFVIPKMAEGRRIVVFISNDFEYYALRSLKKITLLDKKDKIGEVMNLLFTNDCNSHYRAKRRLSNREEEVFF